MKRHYTLLIALLCLLPFASGAQETHIKGEILVRFKPDVQPDRWLEFHSQWRNESFHVTIGPRLAPEFAIWKIHFDWTAVDENTLLQRLRQDPQIEAAQFNHLAYLRARTPNDPRFTAQWHLFNTGQSGGTPGMDIGMPEAWELATGGVTPGNDTIVVCVIDNGLDTSHPDIRPNLWINYGEIPNNGIDDDQNGYVDDYHGWNTQKGNGQISDANYHGTPVSGIIGARGNNATGVSGVNWNVKLMHVVDGFGAISEDRIIQAYMYPYRQRKRYNESKGKNGAFVVATNASWGLSRIKPSEYPIWCAFYDSLGQVGILNVAATESAQNIDVDQVGDMPTACGSDFLVSVNSIDHTGAKAPGGYGAASIDLGAFGENVLSTIPGNNYGLEKGTSFAAPQVTGAIALLYAAKCPTLTVLAENDPPAAATWVKQLLLQGTVPTPSLQGITVTGGRLNVYNSMRRLLDDCGNCPPPSNVQSQQITQTSAQISWISNDSITRVDLRWKETSDSSWTLLRNAHTPVALQGLQPCTRYEFQLATICHTDSNAFSTTFSFRTDGCCLPPQGVQTPFISERDVLVTWNPVTAATSYTIRYRPIQTTTWQTMQAYSNSTGLRNLTACTRYEFQIRSDCPGNTFSDFSPIYTVRTRGCGACLELNYCKPGGIDSYNADQEWIARVRVHDFENTSGKNGYADYTNLNGPTLTIGNSYSIALHPGFPGFSSQEYWIIWMDLNQDGIFSSSEAVFDSGTASRDSVLGLIRIPTTAKPGTTRMRVVMRFKQPGVSCGFPSDFYGEVEDYCVQITSINAVQETTTQPAVVLFPNPFSETIQAQISLPTAQPWLQIEVLSLQGQSLYRHTWKQLPQGGIDLSIGDPQWPDGVYLIRGTSPDYTFIQRIIKQNP
ncbi:MAG: S8 family serine peptidase [Haliscomenobacter sp.]